MVTRWSADPAEQVWGGRRPAQWALGAVLPQDEVRGLDAAITGRLVVVPAYGRCQGPWVYLGWSQGLHRLLAGFQTTL